MSRDYDAIVIGEGEEVVDTLVGTLMDVGDHDRAALLDIEHPDQPEVKAGQEMMAHAPDLPPRPDEKPAPTEEAPAEKAFFPGKNRVCGLQSASRAARHSW